MKQLSQAADGVVGFTAEELATLGTVEDRLKLAQESRPAADYRPETWRDIPDLAELERLLTLLVGWCTFWRPIVDPSGEEYRTRWAGDQVRAMLRVTDGRAWRPAAPRFRLDESVYVYDIPSGATGGGFVDVDTR